MSHLWIDMRETECLFYCPGLAVKTVCPGAGRTGVGTTHDCCWPQAPPLSRPVLVPHNVTIVAVLVKMYHHKCRKINQKIMLLKSPDVRIDKKKS